MRTFTAGPDGTVEAGITRDEALLIQNLASQVSTLLREGSGTDPAIVRLLPDAYPEDSVASAEFRRFTASGLLDRKVVNADTVMLTLSEAIDTGNVRLDAQQVQAWLRCLTDIRLTLASRLGIKTDDQESGGDPMLQELYDWLGFVQNSLIVAIEQGLDETPGGTVSTGDGMGDG